MYVCNVYNVLVFSSCNFKAQVLHDWWDITSGYYYTNKYYRYWYGGKNNIVDGGCDMYDNGNYITFSGAVNVVNVNYGMVGSNYFVSFENVWPFVAMGSICNDTRSLRINVAGNVGSDGLAQVIKSNGVYGYGRFWTVCNFGASSYAATDPSILELWFTIENMNSIVTLTGDSRRNQDFDNYSNYVEITGRNVIFGYSLLSKFAGGYIDSVEIIEILNNIIEMSIIPTTVPTAAPSGYFCPSEYLLDTSECSNKITE
jgi:hypothetical protein